MNSLEKKMLDLIEENEIVINEYIGLDLEATIERFKEINENIEK